MEDGSLTPSVVGQPSSGTLPTPIPIPGVTTVAVKVPATTVSVPPGSSPPEEGHILIRVHVPELNVQKCLQFPRDELVWDVKQQCLAALPKELKESFNYGLFCPPVNGKAGKFLDEERRLADYPFNGPVGYLELKYKRRVYKMVNLDEKQLKALHTRANLRRLLDYVANGQVEKVAKMCSKGLDPNFHCPETGETPLTVASCTRNPSRILVALVNGGALLDFRSKDGSTAMHRAVERNSYEAVKTLLDLGASPNYRDSRGLTPLYIAVAGSHHPHGAPPPVNSSVAPHSSSSSSSSSTSSAVSSSPGPPGGGSSHHHHHHHHHHHSNHPNSVPPNNGPADAMLCEALLHDHAVLGAQDLQGWQEVHQACRNGLVQHLEHLLFYGADTEARNASGNTPLHVCAVDNRESCARLLLFRGADPNALNYANQTPYQVAVIAGNLELAEIIRNHRPENVVPFREPPRYNPKRRWSGCPPSSHPPPSSASSYAIADRPDPPLPPLPRTQSDSRLETPSGAAVNASVSRARHPPPPASIPVSSVAASTNAAGTHHHHQPPLLPQQHHHHHRPPSPSPSNRSLPPFSSASSSLSEASSTGSAATGSTVTDKSLDTVSDSSGVGTSNSGGSSTGGGGTGISIHGSTGGEAVPGMTFETGTTTVVCIEDYPGTLPGHLRIVRGDVIEVTGATDCGLLEGTLHGSSGLFPTHCVQEVHLRQAAVQGIGTNRPSRVRGRRENSIKHFATAPRLKKQLPAEPRTVILHRARRGFGFVLRGAKATSPLMELTPSERCPALQYLDDVDAGGVADMAGLRKGDFLLAINDEDVSQASHEHVVDLIRRSRDLVTMTVVSGLGAGGPGSASMTGVPGAPVGSLPGPGGCRSGSQTLPSRQYSTLPRKMTGGGARTPAPMPPRRDPKTTLSVGRARARSMVAGLSEYEATSRHGRKPSSTEEGEDGEDEDDGDDDDDDEEEEEEEEEEERKRGRRRGHRDSPATVTPTPVPTPPTLPHSTSTLLRHSAKTPPLPQSPPPIPVLPPMPRTPPPGVPKTASIRSRPTSSRITAAELEELFARQGSPVEGMNGIASRGISQTIARGSPPTPKVYASVAEMKRSKDKGSRYRAGTEVLRMLHKAFHSTPDLMASKGQSSPGGRGAPKSRSQDDIPPSGLIHMNSTHQPRLYHHSWRSLERLGAPAMHTRSLPRRPGSSAPPPPTHPPPPPPVGQVVVVDVSQGDYANLDGSADANVAPISPVPAGAGVAPAAPSSTSADSSTIMSSFRPAEGAKLYASPEDVKTVAYRVPSMKGDSTVRRRGSSATAAKNRSQSLPPNSTRPQVAGSSAPSEADTSVCTSFRPDSAAATPVESTAAPVAEPIRDMPPPATSASTAPGSNPYAQPYHGSPPEGKPAEYPVETKSVRYLPTGSDGSGPPIPEPDYSLSESEEGEEGSSEEESKRAVEKPPEPEAVEVTSSPPPVPPTMPETSAGGPSSPRLKDLLVQKVAERRGRLASNGSNGGSEKEEPPVDDKNDTTDGRVQSPKASATSGGLPHSFSVEEIQKVRTQLKSSKSYPSDFLLEDGDNSSSGVSSDQDVQNEHPQPQPTVTVQPVSQPETSTLTRKTKEATRRNTQEDSKHQHQAPPQVRSAPINSIPIQITEFEDSGPERPTVVIEGTKSARSSEGGSRRREEGRRTGGTLTKNAVSLVKLPPPMETDAEGDVGSPVANTTMVPVAAPVATRPTPSATLSGPHRSSERSIEESLRLIKRHADMLNLTDFSRVVPPPPEFGGGAGLGGGRGPSARAEDDFAVLAPPPEFCDTSVDGHRTTIRVVGRKSGARSDGEGTQKVYVTKVKAKNIHHQQAQQEGRVTTVRIVGSVPKNSGQGNMNAERVCAVGENASGCVTGHHGHRPK